MTFTIGPVTLIPGKGRKTPSGKLIVQVAVKKGDVLINTFPLSNSLGGRKDAARLLRGYMGPDGPNADAFEAVFGEILIYVGEALARQTEAEGDTIQEIVTARVPEALQITYRTDATMGSEKRAGEIRRPEFISYTPEYLVELCCSATDAPVDHNGAIDRHAVVKGIKIELEILWASLMEQLPFVVNAELGADTDADDASGLR